MRELAVLQAWSICYSMDGPVPRGVIDKVKNGKEGKGRGVCIIHFIMDHSFKRRNVIKAYCTLSFMETRHHPLFS